MKWTPAQIQTVKDRRIAYLMRKYLGIEKQSTLDARERWRATNSSWASTPEQPTPKEYA